MTEVSAKASDMVRIEQIGGSVMMKGWQWWELRNEVEGLCQQLNAKDAEIEQLRAAMTWKWFGNAGHFICGQWCRFHLCTQVGEFLVSTVGELVHPRHSGGSEQAEIEWLKTHWPGEDVGYGRKYETMVFAVTGICSSPDCGCGMPKHTGHEIEVRGYNDRRAAADGHIELCRQWACREAEEENEPEPKENEDHEDSL